MITIADALASANGREWVSFHCPVHDDTNPSARLNVTSGKYVCMSCGAKGHEENYDPPERMVFEQVYRLGEQNRDIPESYLDLFDIDGPGVYWSDRFTQKACKAFRLGYDSETKQPVYPLRDPQGRVLGVVRRGDGKPKYKYPKGVSTSKLLFNIHVSDPCSTVVLVEGAPDVIALYEAGVMAVGAYGARLYPKQVELLAGLEPSKVLVAFDMDPAGIKGARNAVNDLMMAGVYAKRVTWRGYNDPGEMPIPARRSVFAAA